MASTQKPFAYEWRFHVEGKAPVTITDEGIASDTCQQLVHVGTLFTVQRIPKYHTSSCNKENRDVKTDALL